MNYHDHNSLAGLSDLSAFIETRRHNERSLSFYVDGIHCAGCIRKIEQGLENIKGLKSGRVNFSTNRLRLVWDDAAFNPKRAIKKVERLGFRLVPIQAAIPGKQKTDADRKLLIAMAVAGFGAANIMLLSISVWSGYTSGMGEATRNLFHWISALIALPVIAFSGRPFFTSAIAAASSGRLNMDVPISLAVLAAAGLSLYETATGGQYAYFDAATMLLFFLLVGRYLDSLARAKARAVGEQFLALQSFWATVVADDGNLETISTTRIRPGMTVLVRPGEKVPVDGILVNGTSDLDTSLITGETVPRPAAKGDEVFAGTINLTGTLYIRVEAAGEKTLLSEITELMEDAENFKNRYVRWADKAANIYAPAVHGLGALAFIGWLSIGGLPWQAALTIAISVLIITCPCALGIAVPVVQVVAIGRLLKEGIIVKSGEALEKLSTIKTAIFDKTGTLTTGVLRLADKNDVSGASLRLASALAATSRHPLAVALRHAAPHVKPVTNVKEVPGRGLEAIIRGRRIRLGNRAWCGATAKTENHTGPEMWLRIGREKPVCFRFDDTLKEDAKATVKALQAEGFDVILLSGDQPQSVAAVARALGIKTWFAGETPDKKLKRLEEIKHDKGRLLMVGDGLNDAPALSLADTSMSPASAADISQTAADIVFQGNGLQPVVQAVTMARKSRALIFQNFSLAVLYNVIAIPIAVAGYATPLIAAIAMSTSSLVVILNALRARTP